MAMTIADVLPLLRDVKKAGDGYIAKCPAHEDKKASLSIKAGDKVGIVFYCHAGCDSEAVAGALGLSMRDLMGDSKPQANTSKRIVATYDYRDESGTVLFQKVRYEPKGFTIRRPDGRGGWEYNRKGVKLIPYNLQALLASDYVFLVEGEKDVETLRKMQLAASCSPDGAGKSGKFKSELIEHFKGKSVYILPDNDAVGKAYAHDEARLLAPVAKIVKILDPLQVCPDLPDGGDITDIVARYGAEHTTNALRELVKSTPSYTPQRTQDGRDWIDNPPKAETQAWPELTPFERCEILPPFPLDVLPPATREYVYAASETVQAPVDMVASCVLGALQIACRGRYPVRLPNGHIERPCLYIAPIAPPSERKSGVIEVATRPLIDFEATYNRINDGAVNQSRSELKLLQGKIVNVETQAIKEKDSGRRRAAELELQNLNSELAEFKTVEPLRLFGADVTPEKLAAMTKAQDEVFALVSAEGGGLFENINRYSERGGMEIYLSGYSGDRICVDRKNSESIVIDSPTLSIIAPLQPSVVVDLFSDKQKTGRGLLSRILFVQCLSRVGSRKATATPISDRAERNYRNLCHGMLDAESRGNLAYDSKAYRVYVAFHDEIEAQLHPDTGELAAIADWAGKLHGQMTRFAGLIHCINAFEAGRSPLDTPINDNEVHAAVELARYYLAHAQAVYGEQAEPEAITNARYLWSKVKVMRDRQTEPITKRDLRRKIHGKQEFDLDSALEMLVERGYIRIENAATGGRPSEAIIVNPATETLLTKASTGSGYTNETIPADVPSVIAAKLFDTVPADVGNNPFLEAPTQGVLSIDDDF